MKVVVLEDDDAKWEDIRDCLLSKHVRGSGIKRVSTVSQFVEVANKPFDLCIIDIRMPGVTGGESRSAGTEILHMLDYSGGRRVPVLAITAYPDEATHLREVFSSHGCIIFDYGERQIWSQALDIFIAQAAEKGRYDFLLFTSLKKERDAYLELPGIKIDSTERGGLDLWDFELGTKSGAIVLLPRMGIINAAVVVARALELYTPALVGMSGICAGIGTNAHLGQLLVTDLVFEYQSGKWLDEAFEAEPYQVNIPQNTRLAMCKLLEQRDLLARLESFHPGQIRPSRRSEPKLAVFTSGSAVIASERRIEAVAQQHRKVSGLDIELFGLHRAVELSNQAIHALSAKVVVDKADESKGDELHDYGCVVSAAFLIEPVKALLA